SRERERGLLGDVDGPRPRDRAAPREQLLDGLAGQQLGHEVRITGVEAAEVAELEHVRVANAGHRARFVDHLLADADRLLTQELDRDRALQLDVAGLPGLGQRTVAEHALESIATTDDLTD